jgi:acyl carrier protein
MPEEVAERSVSTKFVDVVAEILAVESPDRSRSFRDLGGDSLSAIIVAETLRDDGIVVTAEELLSDLAIDRVAALMETRQS